MSVLLMLDDGPCLGAYTCKRAPTNLRAVRHRDTGKTDVLDLVEDAPADGEDVHLYLRTSDRAGHVCGRGFGGCMSTVSYRWVGALTLPNYELVDADPVQRAWWEAQAHTAMIAWAQGKPYTPEPPCPIHGADAPSGCCAPPPPSPEPEQMALL